MRRLITNGQVYQDGEFRPLDILVADGAIASIGIPGTFDSNPDFERLDAGGRLVLPGAIDSHFHCRAPSHPERETFATATAAAAAGGVTSLIEMPISEPPTINGAVVRERAALATQEGYVDVGFYSSSATLNRDDLISAREAGALAYKGFLQNVPEGREGEFLGLCLPTSSEVLQAFQLLAEFDLPCVFHAEDETMLRHLETGLKEAGRRDGPAHVASRPDFVESSSVSLLLQLAERFGVHLHVPHVSSRLTVSLIRDAKARGVQVTAETCPHYLAFDESALARLGSYGKCNPPLKSLDDQAALWEAILDGTIDTLASDHSPFTAEEKDRARDDIWTAPPGFPGVEVLVPFVVGAALEGRMSWPRATSLIYENPARIFGLWPEKGAIRVHGTADLVIYDPGCIGVFRHENLYTRAAATGLLWDDYPRRGQVMTTLLRGEVVYHDGEIVGPQGAGRQLRRPIG